jgi:MGT family glycosyltransferase
MARFLFTVWPYPGHIHPNVAIAHALVERGHEVAFYTGGSAIPSLEAEGFRGFPFRRLDEAAAEKIVLTLDAQSLEWWKAFNSKALLTDWLLGTIDAQLEDVLAVLRAWRPDVMVGDPGMWGPLLVLQETEQIPLAVMSYFAACMLPGPDGDIVGLPLAKAQGPIARFGRRVLRSVAHLLTADVRRRVEAVRSRHGLSPIGMSATAFAGQMPLYIVPSTPGYDRQRRDLPPSVQYVGPCIWDKPNEAPPPSWLREMSPGRPLVYVTEGTMHAKQPLVLRAALQGLASLSVQVVVTTGNRRDPETLGLGAIPANARVERFVPQSDLLPHTDVVVTTGGTGGVLATLSAGVPLVIVPTAWDQPDNAWRVAEAGAGIRVHPRDCTPARIRAAVERVLGDPSFKQNAQRLSSDFAGFGGAVQAADLLEDLSRRRGRFAPRHEVVAASGLPGGRKAPSAAHGAAR